MSEKKSLLDGWNSIPNIITYVRIVMMFAFLYFAGVGGPYGHTDTRSRWIAAIL